MGRKKKSKSKKGSANQPAQHRASNARTAGHAHRKHSYQGAPTAHHPTIFSLTEEAKFTSGHRSQAFDAATKLRDRPIRFVSAGLLEGTLPQMEKEREDLVNSPELDSIHAASAMAQMTIQSSLTPESSISSSSEDEIVFQGRATANVTNLAAAPPVAAATDHRPQSTPIITQIIETPDLAHLPCSPPLATTVELHSRPLDDPARDSSTDSDDESVVQDVFEKRLNGQSKWMTGTTPWESRSKPGIGWLPVQDRPDMAAFLAGAADPSTDAMDDYMQNIIEYNAHDQGTIPSTFAHRAMDTGEDVDVNRSGARTNLSQEHAKIWVGDGEWDSDMIRDLDDLSTSSDVIDTVERIVSKRVRKTGVQYLVVYKGYTPDDARWLPSTFLKTTEDIKLIDEFEISKAKQSRPILSSGDSDESWSLGDDDDEDDREDTNDENDVVEEGEGSDYWENGFGENDEDMNDERLAKILQKQEELGLGSDDIVLFGEDEFAAESNGPRRLPARIDRPWTKRKSKSNRQPLGFTSATALADVLEQDPYGGFDIMDLERPSLRPKKKGRRGQLPPEISDSELNEQMQATWEKDRARKRLKKAEREELRSQGLLGRKGRAAKLSAKFMDFDQVEDEIREFMFSDVQSLALPPMESKRRAVVHQFIRHFGLNSRSRGDGLDRFVVVSKTSRTKNIDDEEFDQIVGQKRFKSRLQGALPRSVRNGPKVRPTVSYRDGEIVGATAPELGPENKGRRLLEKMGWTKGTALGALENKGILQPITHTVKTTKAGLQ